MFFYKVSFDELNALISCWKWAELRYGLSRGYISRKDIILYAKNSFSQDIPYVETLIRLVIAEEEEVDEILEELVNSEGNTDECDIISKWIFALLYHAYSHDNDRMFEIIEEIYGEFSYPNEIRELIPYMPREDGMLLEERLKIFIEQGKNKWI